MTKLIAVDGMTVEVDVTTVTPPGTVTATIVVLPPTGTKAKVDNKLMYRDGDQITVTAITHSAGASTPDPGPHTVAFESTATKTKAEGTLVLLEGDQTALISATPQLPGPPPVAFPITFKCKVSVAGQTKAKTS